MYSIGKLGKKFNISRSALLYYDSIGLLPATEISPSGYRLYSEQDAEKLEQILKYRKTGLSLEEIGQLIRKEYPEDETIAVLFDRLGGINAQIDQLKEQQKIIIKLIQSQEFIKKAAKFEKSQFISMLKNVGIKVEDFQKWHRSFEEHSPELHAAFLKTIGLTEDEIEAIRKGGRWSK